MLGLAEATLPRSLATLPARACQPPLMPQPFLHKQQPLKVAMCSEEGAKS